MDYEKLHKDTIAKLQEMVNSGKITVEIARGICADFIPESEDERIRKALLEYFGEQCDMSNWNGVYGYEVYAWLEKQGEQKTAEWNLPYGKNETAEKLIALAECLEMDGSCLFNGLSGNDYGKLLRVLARELTEIKPAWSEEDEKILKELVEEVKDQLDSVPSPDCMDKEDEKVLKMLNKWMNFLESIKDRVQPQPKQEWSEEDKKYIAHIIAVLESWDREHLSSIQSVIPKCIDWLKSIKLNHWKPSKEQLEALEHFVRSIGESGYASPYDNNTKLIYSLLNDLKKF